MNQERQTETGQDAVTPNAAAEDVGADDSTNEQPVAEELSSDHEVNAQFNRMVDEVLGDGASEDQRALGSHFERVSPTGLVVVPDPADLEPVRYPELTRDEAAEYQHFAMEAARIVTSK